jgi:hypothetical protein
MGDVSSQYQLAEMRDYPALNENPYMLKAATAKFVEEPPVVSTAHSDYFAR